MGDKAKETTKKLVDPRNVYTRGAYSIYEKVKEKREEEKTEKKQRKLAEQEAAALEERRILKEEDLATRRNKRTGLASLMGGDSQSDTLG